MLSSIVKPICLDACPDSPESAVIRFIHPLRLKVKDKIIRPHQFSAVDFGQSLLRRYFQLLSVHENHSKASQYSSEEISYLHALCSSLSFENAHFKWYEWFRFSNRQNKKIPMSGLVGEAVLRGRGLSLLWSWLWLGQWLHVGKGAVMGMGAYSLTAS